MKTAIVCDWLVKPGGAEVVLQHLLDCFPNADLFAIVDFVAPEQRNFLKNKSVRTTFIQKLPLAKKYYRQYLPLMPYAIEQLDVSQYDLVISSSHAVAKGIITGPHQLHISYVHTPMRYAWDLQHQYLQETGMDKSIKGHIARYFLHKLRLWDARSANGVDYFIANSAFIAKRILKTYRREAKVIYPPVHVPSLETPLAKEDYYIAASRLVPYKKMDLIVESFQQLPDKKLIVFGEGPEWDKVKSKAGANVEMMGYQPNAILYDKMQRAKALIFAAEEDFGIVAVEAQACGTPVIAYGKGGVLEIVHGLDQPNPTGLFFNEQSKQAICAAIQHFEMNESRFTAENCMANAQRFQAHYFQKNLQQFVSEKLQEFRSS